MQCKVTSQGICRLIHPCTPILVQACTYVVACVHVHSVCNVFVFDFMAIRFHNLCLFIMPCVTPFFLVCSAMAVGVNGPLPGSVLNQPAVLGGEARRTPLASYFGGSTAAGVSQGPSSSISNVDAVLLPGEIPGARPRGLLSGAGVAAGGLMASGGDAAAGISVGGGSGGGAGGLGGFNLAGYGGGVNVLGGQLGAGSAGGVHGGNMWSQGLRGEPEGAVVATGATGGAGGLASGGAAGGGAGAAGAGAGNGFSPLTSPVSANLGSIAEGAALGSQELNLEHLLLPSSLAMLS